VVGSELKKVLGMFGIRDNGCRLCIERAALLDAAGPDWVEQNIDIPVGWLREQAEARGMPFLDMAGRLLVRRAIANARRNVTPVPSSSDSLPH
jgi:hypothetical protein